MWYLLHAPGHSGTSLCRVLTEEGNWLSAQTLQAESLGLPISSAALTQCDPGQVPHSLQTSLCVEGNSRIYSLGSREGPQFSAGKASSDRG